MSQSFTLYKTRNKLEDPHKVFNDIFGYDFVNIEKKTTYEHANLYSCRFEKIVNDTIGVWIEGSYKEFDKYKKTGIVDIYSFDDFIAVAGSYEDRYQFSKIMRTDDVKHFLADPKVFTLDLKSSIEKFDSFKSLSLKDYSATITKLKTSGQMTKEDKDIQEFMEKTDHVTALTIIYPWGDDTIDIHVTEDGRIRITDNNGLLSTIEDMILLLYNFYDTFVKVYKKE